MKKTYKFKDIAELIELLEIIDGVSELDEIELDSIHYQEQTVTVRAKSWTGLCTAEIMFTLYGYDPA